LRRTAARAGSLLLLASLGCERSSKPTPAPAPSASSLAGTEQRVFGGELSSTSAFELVVADDGLRLLWAVAPNGTGWLRDVRIAQDGAPVGEPRTEPVPRRALGAVTDLSAAFLGDQLAAAWIEQGKSEARAVATVLRGADAPLLDLGAASLAAESARGNLVLAAEEPRGRALVMWRALEAPCVEPQSSPCTGFAFRRLKDGAAEATGLPMSVPVPCASHSVQLAVSPGRFHYGVCTRDGAAPVTTMFSIQYEPEYARAEPLLKGCVPLGTLDVSGRPWLVADCHGKRRAVPVPLTDEKVEPEDVDKLQVTCTPERAVLRQGRFALTLREPRAGLQAILPNRWLPAGARAAWSGKSLVVAYLDSARLVTRSYACRAGSLEPL
jgi:hypothetical protein